MKRDFSSQFGFFNLRILLAFTFCLIGVGLTLLSVSAKAPTGVIASGAKSSRNSVTAEQIRHGVYRGHPVTYVVKNGKAIYQGDIIIEKVDSIDPRHPLSSFGVKSLSLDYSQYLWPRVGNQYQIPYIITAGSGNLTNLNTAITQFNSTFSIIKFVARTTQTDYVNFYFDPNDNSAQGEATISSAAANNPSKAQVDRSIPARSAPSCTKWDMPSVFGTSSLAPTATPTSRSITPMWSRAPFTTTTKSTTTRSKPPYSTTHRSWSTRHSPSPAMARQLLNPFRPESRSRTLLVTRPQTSMASDGSMATLPPPLPSPVILRGYMSSSMAPAVTTPQVFNWALNSTHTLDIPSGVRASRDSSSAATLPQPSIIPTDAGTIPPPPPI